MTTLIPENDIWTIWAIVIGIAALAFFLEQRFKWGAKRTFSLDRVAGFGESESSANWFTCV